MNTPRSDRRRQSRRIACVAVPVVAVIVVLLLLRGCGPKSVQEPTPVAREALFVPRDLARLKQLDRDGVLDYCRTQIRPANYQGILRGAHGALWAGEANAWDRTLLAAEALEGMRIETRIVPDDIPRLAYKDASRWAIVRVDAPGDAEIADEPPATSIALADLPTKRPELFHTIQAAFVLDQDGGGQARIPYLDRVADWVHRPVTLYTVGAGVEMKLRLQVGNLVMQSVGVDGVRRARLEITWRFKEQSAIWTRELFDRANASPEIPGHDASRAGDRYAIVLAAGPLVPEVLATRARMIELPGYTPVEDEQTRELLRLGVKYQVDGDEQTRKLAEECGVAVSWVVPRIAIVAAETAPDEIGEPGLTMDALADSVDASGKRAREFHVARGLAADLIETRVIHGARRQPVISTSTVFSNFKADSPDSPTRRVARIETEARRVLAEEPIGTTVVLTALPPRAMPPEVISATPKRPQLMIERISSGLALRGLKRLDKADVPWAGYEWSESGTVAFADRFRELATVTDGMLARKAGHLDYMLAFEVRSMWPRQTLPIANGSVLTYAVQLKDKSERLEVAVSLHNGSPVGTWTRSSTGKSGTVAGKWPDVLSNDTKGLSVGAFLVPATAAGELTNLTVRVGDNDRRVAGRQLAIPGGSATVLDGTGLPIVLEWQRGDLSLRLESASPVVRGSTLDADTGLPAAATVALRRPVSNARRTEIDLRKIDVAADGSFALAVPAERRRLILVLDRSGSMSAGLDPKFPIGRGAKPAAKGEQRIDYLRKAVNGLLDKLPRDVEVALWSFASGRLSRDEDSPNHVKVECPFTTDVPRLRQALAGIVLDSGTPITGAVHRILNHVAEDPLSANALFVLMTDGENTSSTPAVQAYRERKGTIAIHTIGFAIEPGGKAEKELRDIAGASGGTFRIAGTGAELTLAFGAVGIDKPDSRLAVTSTCHAPTDVQIPAARLGSEPLTIGLTHGCATCKCTGKQLLTIGKETVGKLSECAGLSPKARTMIEERVKDGLWTVTIPSSRVNLGLISAYAWWESENATGRMVGRTEDGLHGATADPRSWPGAAAEHAGNIPFVAWYTGIVAYTAGSVDAALRWTREPGFMAGGPEGFKQFVQANALDFCGRWWSEVGASAFPQNIHNYWSGVCLNFTLQSMALGMPAANCFRHWAGAMCDQAAGAAKDIPKEFAGKFFDDNFGAQYRDLYKRAKEWSDRLGPHASAADRTAAQDLFEDLDKFKKSWDNGVDQAFHCDRLRGRR